MFHDIHEDTHMKLIGSELDYLNWCETVDADDTVLVGHRARQISILLAASDKMSVKDNLKLNYDKCTYIAVNGKARIHFSNGKPFK